MTAPVWPVGSNAYPQPPQQGYQQQGYQQQGYGPAEGFPPPIGFPPPNGLTPPNGFAPPQGPGFPGSVPPPAPRRSRLRWVAVLVGVLAVAGIVVIGMINGTTSGLNVERALHSALTDSASITTVSNVQCPDQLSTNEGTTVVCQASVDGQATDLTLTFDRDDHFVVTSAVPR